MRRSVLAIAGTVAGTALMIGAKLGTAPPDDPAATAASDAGAISAGGPGPAGAQAAAPAPASAPGAGPTSTAPGAPPPPAGGGKTTAPAPPPTTGAPAPGGMKDGKYTGSAGVSRYGYTVSVSITISGGKITAATGGCGSASGESRSYCTGAMPKLQQETLSAQSASVATVSGATYTSRAYKSSLQAAIDASKA